MIGHVVNSHISGSPGELDVMVPLNQCSLLADIIPYDICKTAPAGITESSTFRLPLHLVEELLFVNLAIQLPQNLLALIITEFCGLIARYFVDLIICFKRGGFCFVFIFEIDGFLNQNTRTRGLKIWTDPGIPG